MITERKVFVLGHKNPDTDSICSAISLSYLKNQLGEVRHAPRRAGQINEETEFVLKYFGFPAPDYLADAATQVCDMEIRRQAGISKELSVRKAYELMQDQHAFTLPILSADNKLEGLITVGDIMECLANQDPRALSAAHTPYKNIAETLDGEILTGDGEQEFTEGKIFIGAAAPDMVRHYIEPSDLVILGDRAEDHLCAVEMKASCIVVAMNANISPVILRFAEEMGCVFIRTPYDTLKIARLITQSIPVKALMISKGLVQFRLNDFTEKIAKIMAEHRFRDFPILDKNDRYVGTISRRNLLGIQKKKLILVDHNEVSQAVDNVDDADILEIVDHHRIADLETVQPIIFRNQPVGCTATIITMMYGENQIEIPEKIAGLLCAAIISDTLMFRSPTCTALDQATAEKLAGIAGIDIVTFAKEMFRAGSNFSNKSNEEMFYNDFKKFLAGEILFGVGQISSLSIEELQEIQERMLPTIEEEYSHHGMQMIFYMLTDILEKTTKLICCGEGAAAIAESAFGVKVENGECVLPGIVSRKKQLIPALMQAIQEV